jgi:hypothetical protein
MKKSELKKENIKLKFELALAKLSNVIKDKIIDCRDNRLSNIQERFASGGYVSNAAHNKISDILKKSREDMINSMGKEAKDLDSKIKPQAGDQIAEPTKETPLTDLAKEVDIEKKANELIDKFMPLVNGWRANDPCCLIDAEIDNVVWSLSDYNKHKAAIKCAIMHLNLSLAYGYEKNSEIEEVKAILFELQKMLSE